MLEKFFAGEEVLVNVEVGEPPNITNRGYF